MHKVFKSLRAQFTGASVLVILFTLAVITLLVNWEVTQKAETDYIRTSSEQMRNIAKTIDIFYEQIDNNINMMASHPLVMRADDSLTSYVGTSERIMMSPSKNGGLEQEIYDVFAHYADAHPGTMYVYFGLESGPYLQWPETEIAADYVPSSKFWYQTGQSGNGSIVRTAPYLDSMTNTLITSNVRSFTDENGRVIGTIGIDVQQTVISDMLSEMRVGETGYLMIVHNTGMIMADGNNAGNNFKTLEEVGIPEFDNLLLDDPQVFEANIDGKRWMVNPMKVPGTDWVLASLLTFNEMQSGSRALSTVVLIVAIIMLAVTVVVMMLVTRQITIPIVKSSAYLKTIASGDFTVEVAPRFMRRQDEIGEITRGINEMKNALRALVGSINKESGAISDEVSQVMENVIVLNTGIEEISATTQELAASMEETAASSQVMTETSRQIETAVQSIAQKSQDGAEAAGQINKRAESTKQRVTDARTKAERIISENREKLQQAIEESKVVRQIDILTESIMKITEQTNLLALNAAIEAARAGEAGRGFSVVSDEIRKLAEQSKDTAIRIQTLTQQVTQSVDNLTGSSNDLLSFVSRDVTDDYHTMLEVAEQYNGDAIYVDELVSDFSSTSEELLASIHDILSALDGVARAAMEGAGGTTDIARRAVDISGKSSDVKAQVLLTREGAVRLMKEIERFEV